MTGRLAHHRDTARVMTDQQSAVKPPVLRIVVVGHGRLGKAMAVAAKAQGHEVRLLLHRPRVGKAAENGFSAAASPRAVDWRGVDALLLAVALEDPSKYPDETTAGQALREIAQASAAVAVLSASGTLQMAELTAAFADRPVARFMCSTAIGRPDSLRFYDEASDPGAVHLLTRIFPSDRWEGLRREAYDRRCSLLVTAALACRVLERVATAVADIDPDERAFAIETLGEALRLIEVHGGDPAAAYEASATPGGLVERLAGAVLAAQPRIHQEPDT